MGDKVLVAGITAKVWTFFKTMKWTSIITALSIAIVWNAIPIFIRQDKVNWEKVVKHATSFTGMISILGLVFGVYLITKEIKKK